MSRDGRASWCHRAPSVAHAVAGGRGRAGRDLLALKVFVKGRRSATMYPPRAADVFHPHAAVHTLTHLLCQSLVSRSHTTPSWQPEFRGHLARGTHTPARDSPRGPLYAMLSAHTQDTPTYLDARSPAHRRAHLFLYTRSSPLTPSPQRPLRRCPGPCSRCTACSRTTARCRHYRPCSRRSHLPTCLRRPC